MSNHYRKGKLVETDILPRHANTYYYKINNNLYEFYSYDTLVGYIMLCNVDKYDFTTFFVEWAHTQHYSVTTSKQCTVLQNELKRMYGGRHKIVTIDQGFKELELLRKNPSCNYILLHYQERNFEK